MFPFLLSYVVFALLYQHGLSQESGAITAQSICNSMGAVGLYSNPVDVTCKQYVKCFINNNVLIGAFYNCTGATLFNPNLKYCTTGFNCATTTTTTTSETTTEITTTTSETTTEITTTTAETTTEITTTTLESTTPETTTAVTSTTTLAPISAQSICDSQNAVGRYPNIDDDSCKQYSLCFENNGSLSGSFYNCTGTTLFDPSLQLCTTEYQCSQ